MVTFECPHCRSSLHVDDKYIGTSGKCNHCGGRVTIGIHGPLTPQLVIGGSGLYKEFARKGEELIEAAAKGERDAVRRLLQEGAHVNARNKYGVMPLHAAARAGDVELVKLLLVEGADVNAHAGDGCIPLHWAASACRVDMVRFLIGRTYNVDAKDKDGQTPLHLAARVDHDPGQVAEIVEMLLARGADVNARSKDGSTPLKEASELGCPEVAALLRHHGGQ